METLTEQKIRDGINILRNRGVSLNSIAKASGVQQSGLSRFMQGRTLTLSSFFKMWPVIEKELKKKDVFL